MTDAVHLPAMLDEVAEYLQPRPGARFIDATVNGGGHTTALLARSAPNGRVLGIDRDRSLIAALRQARSEEVAAQRLLLAEGSFGGIGAIAAAHDFTGVDGVLFDLGLSSYHLDRSGRGFSFSREEPLDMRFDPSDPTAQSAADIVASWSVEELSAIFREYGEERFAWRIAQRIVRLREHAPITTTTQLLEAITAALPGNVRWRASRSAARIFQSLRIAANAELAQVREALPQAAALLAPGGRLVVLCFHSLEDRIVKQFFVAERDAGRMRILTKRPVRPSEAEVERNPRAGSTKLRAAERVEGARSWS